MTVRKRMDGRWQFDIVIHRNGKRIRDRGACSAPSGAPARNRAEALKCEQARRAELEGGTPSKKETVTFEEHAADCMRLHVALENKASEQDSKRMILARHLLEFFGPLPLHEITAHKIALYKATKTGKNKPKTINNQLGVLSKFLNLAVEWGRLRTAPKVKFLRVGDQPFDFFDFDEAARLFATAEAAWAPMIAIAFKAGLRQSEILELRWDDVDLVRGVLHIRRAIWHGIIDTPKGGRGRDVPLGDDLRGLLRAARHLKGELVFCGPAGEQLTKGACKWPLWRACKRAGLRRVGWHVGRHSFASHLVMRGVPLKAVQELLGHVTIDQTLRYAHLSPDVGRDAVRLLDAPTAPSTAKKAG